MYGTTGEELTDVEVFLPRELLAEMDEHVESEGYDGLSPFVRAALEQHAGN